MLIGRGALPWPLSGLAITSIVIVALQLLAVGLAAFGSTIAGDPIRLQTMTSLLAAVFGLVMIEQFYRGLPSDSRWAFAADAGAGGDLCLRSHLFCRGCSFSGLIRRPGACVAWRMC